MSIVLDSRGQQVDVKTRRGIDTQVRLVVYDPNGVLQDFTGHTVVAQLDDGTRLHDLLVTNGGDHLFVHITGDLSQQLPDLSRYSVETLSPNGIRTSLLYGLVSTEAAYP